MFKSKYSAHSLAEWWSSLKLTPGEPSNFDDALFHVKVSIGYLKDKKQIAPSAEYLVQQIKNRETHAKPSQKKGSKTKGTAQ